MPHPNKINQIIEELYDTLKEDGVDTEGNLDKEIFIKVLASYGSFIEGERETRILGYLTTIKGQQKMIEALLEKDNTTKQ